MTNKKMIIPTVALSLMTVVSAVSGLNVALPSIALDLGASQSQLTWIVDAYTVVFAGLLLLAGAISDKYGRRLTLVVGLSLYLVANIFGYLVETPEQLIAIRLVTGIGAAFIMPSTLSVITTSFEKEERAKAISIWVGVAGGGAVIGLFGSAALLEFYTWQSFFGLNFTLALIGLLGTLRYIPESAESETKIDWFAGLLSVAGATGIVFGIIEGVERGWTDIVTVSALLTGTLAITWFVLNQLKSAHPLLDPREFKNRAFAMGSLSITIQFMVQFGFFFVALQYLQFIVGFSPWEAAIRLLPLPFFLMPSARIAGKLSIRFSQKLLGGFGLASLAAGLYTFSTMTPEFNYIHFVSGLALFGIGVGFAGTPATTAITNSMPEEKQGVASAVNDLAREFGSALGIAILGATLTSTYKDEMAVVTAGLPAEAVERISSSVAFAQIQPPMGMEQMWDQLVAAGINAFNLGMQNSLSIASLIAGTAAIVIAVFAPRKTKPNA